MPPSHMKNKNIKLNKHLLHIKPTFTLMSKSLNIFSSIACNLTIASNQQRQEHNNLATIWRAKL